MIILPAIDIHQGQCVRLTKGDYSTAAKVASDPVETALEFQQQGASWLHMVDLDGAKDGTQPNKEIFVEVARQTKMKIELGGGIRDYETACSYLESGIDRIILGSAALYDPQLVRDLVAEFADRIAVGIDARHGLVQADGWLKSSTVDYLTLAKEMEQIGVKYIIYTDISKDGTLQGPNLEQLQKINEAVEIDIIASGGISNSEDIRELKKLNLYGAICGKSIYQKTLDLGEAIRIGNEG